MRKMPLDLSISLENFMKFDSIDFMDPYKDGA